MTDKENAGKRKRDDDDDENEIRFGPFTKEEASACLLGIIASYNILGTEEASNGEALANQDDKPADDKPDDDKPEHNKPADDKPDDDKRADDKPEPQHEYASGEGNTYCEKCPAGTSTNHNKPDDDKPATGQNNVKDDSEGFSTVDMHTTIENLKEMYRAGFKLPNNADEDKTPLDIAFDKAYNADKDDDNGKDSREAFVQLLLEPMVREDSNIKESLSIMVNAAKHEGKNVVHAFQENKMQYDSYVRAKAQVHDACKKLKTARDIIDDCSEEISGALANMRGAE